MTNEDRIRHHLTIRFGERLVSSFRREELQDFLEQKAAAGLSYSVVAHLRWDLRQNLRMAREEGLIDPQTTASLVRGYRFLRRIENCLRIVRDRSADRLPRTAQGLEVMARRLGYRQQFASTPGAQLLAEYQEQTGSIRGIYERIFRQV